MILKKITVIFIIFFINFWFINVANSENNTFFISIDLVLEKTLLGKKIIKELDDIEKKNQKILTEIKSKITESENNLNSSKNIISKEDYNLKLVQLKNDIDIFNEKKNDLIKSFDAQRKKK